MIFKPSWTFIVAASIACFIIGIIIKSDIIAQMSSFSIFNVPKGILIGRFGIESNSDENASTLRDEEISSELLNEIDPSTIDSYLKWERFPKAHCYLVD